MENNSNMCFSTPGKTRPYFSTDRVFIVDEENVKRLSRIDVVLHFIIAK